MPQLLSASAPVERWSGVLRGSATRTRSGSSSLLLSDLQDDAERGVHAELVRHLDAQPERASLLRRSCDLPGAGVQLQALRQRAGTAAEDAPVAGRDSAGGAKRRAGGGAAARQGERSPPHQEG